MQASKKPLTCRSMFYKHTSNKIQLRKVESLQFTLWGAKQTEGNYGHFMTWTITKMVWFLSLLGSKQTMILNIVSSLNGIYNFLFLQCIDG